MFKASAILMAKEIQYLALEFIWWLLGLLMQSIIWGTESHQHLQTAEATHPGSLLHSTQPKKSVNFRIQGQSNRTYNIAVVNTIIVFFLTTVNHIIIVIGLLEEFEGNYNNTNKNLSYAN